MMHDLNVKGGEFLTKKLVNPKRKYVDIDKDEDTGDNGTDNDGKLGEPLEKIPRVMSVKKKIPLSDRTVIRYGQRAKREVILSQSILEVNKDVNTEICDVNNEIDNDNDNDTEANVLEK